ncbi:MAG: lysophospholipid acyltransferase family protein [Candidatus Eisenbacteria bacterium]
MSRHRYPWWLGPAGIAGAAIVQVLGRTWRIDQQDDPEYLAAERGGEKFLYYFWHARLLPLVYSYRAQGIAVLVSQHRDGELIARISEGMGFITGRGSSTRGGESGVREMLKHARDGRHLAITPDGPRGPAEELKDGLAFLASRLQRQVVPIATASNHAWVARSWDRFRVPHPFARVCILHGAPVRVPPNLDAHNVIAVQRSLQQALHDLTARARIRAGEAA